MSVIQTVDATTGEVSYREMTEEEVAAREARYKELGISNVPAYITPRQCRLLLHQKGMLQQVEAMVAASTDDVKITWEYALEFRRDDPILNAFAANLLPPLTDEQIDQFFIEAAKL